MNRDDAIHRFEPLDLEQVLHFLDAITWYPEDSTRRWEQVAEYVHGKCPDGRSHTGDQYRQIFARLLQEPADEGVALADRWKLIGRPKRIYQLKYDVMTLLYPDQWFTFMNMGYAEPGGPAVDLPLAGDAPGIMRYAANLYEQVACDGAVAGLDVCEIGCGRGGGAAFVMRRHGPRSLIGVDYSPNNVAFCRERHGVPGLDFRQGDAEALELPDSSADVVLSVESAHCYPSIERFLAEVRRVLRPGGRFSCATLWWSDAVAHLHAAVDGSGLETASFRDITAQVIEALTRLEAELPAFLAEIADPALRRTWERFFLLRFCRQVDSYRDGRVRFFRFTCRKPATS